MKKYRKTSEVLLANLKAFQFEANAFHVLQKNGTLQPDILYGQVLKIVGIDLHDASIYDMVEKADGLWNK